MSRVQGQGRHGGDQYPQGDPGDRCRTLSIRYPGDADTVGIEQQLHSHPRLIGRDPR